MNLYIGILLFSTLVLTVASEKTSEDEVIELSDNKDEKLMEKKKLEDELEYMSDDDKLAIFDDLFEEHEEADKQVFKKKDPVWFWSRRRAPAPAPAPAPRPSGNKPPKDKESCLTKHNFFRRKHRDTPDLVWDNDLARGAQQYADYLKNTNKWEHSKDLSAQLGENLAKSSGYPLAGACDRAITNWYNEINMYNYGSPGFGMNTGHFTQVVWKSTTKVGVGIATNGRTIWVVGRYSPSGNMNMPGYFARNVQPLK